MTDCDALRLLVQLGIATAWGSNRDVVRVDYEAEFPLPIYR